MCFHASVPPTYTANETMLSTKQKFKQGHVCSGEAVQWWEYLHTQAPMVVMGGSVWPGQDGNLFSCQLKGKSGFGSEGSWEHRELVASHRWREGFLGTGGGSKLLVKRFTSEGAQPCRTVTVPPEPRAAGPNLWGSQAGFRNDSQYYPTTTTSLWGSLRQTVGLVPSLHAATETISQTRGRRGRE